MSERTTELYDLLNALVEDMMMGNVWARRAIADYQTVLGELTAIIESTKR